MPYKCIFYHVVLKTLMINFAVQSLKRANKHIAT